MMMMLYCGTLSIFFAGLLLLPIEICFKLKQNKVKNWINLSLKGQTVFYRWKAWDSWEEGLEITCHKQANGCKPQAVPLCLLFVSGDTMQHFGGGGWA